MPTFAFWAHTCTSTLPHMQINTCSLLTHTHSPTHAPTKHRYVHRVGRTARLDTDGSALIMLLPSEVAYLDELRKHGITDLAPVAVADILGSLVGQPPGSALGHAAKDAANALQLRCEKAVSESSELNAAAAAAYRSFVRAYTT
jgi:superfamily II DNA/RNA helicase